MSEPDIDTDLLAAQLKQQATEAAAQPANGDDGGAPQQPEFNDSTVDVDALANQLKEQKTQETQRSAQLLQWRSANSTVAPDQQANILRYSAASGLAPDFVKDNLDQVRKQVDSRGVDWEGLAKERPALADFLQNNPHAQPVVNDDIANLGFMEKWITGKWSWKTFDASGGLPGVPKLSIPYLGRDLPTAPEAALDDAVAQERLNYYGAKRTILGPLSEEDRRTVQEIKAFNPPRELVKGKWYESPSNIAANAILGTIKMSPMLVGSTAATAAGTLAGGPIGGFAAGATYNAYESLGPTTDALENLQGPKGEKLSDNQVRATSVVASIIGGTVMQAGLTPIVRSVAGPLLRETAMSAVETAMKSPTWQSLATKAMTEYGKHLVGGAAAMAAQSAVNNTAEQLAAKSAWDAKFDTQQLGRVTAESFVQGFGDMLLIAAAGPGREFLQDAGRIRSSRESTQRLEQLIETSKQSKVLQRSPELFQQVVDGMAAQPDSQISNVYHPVEEWVQYWQEKKVDPALMAAQLMGDGGKAFQEALATNGDLAIPAGSYLSKLGNTEHITGLSESRKLALDELTPRQQKTEQERLEKKLEEQATKRGDELKEGKKAVFDLVYEQAVAAEIPKEVSRKVATLASENAGTMALVTGKSVRDVASIGLYDRLRVLGPNGEVAAQKVLDNFRQFLKPDTQKPIASFDGAEVFADLGPEPANVDTSFDFGGSVQTTAPLQQASPEALSGARDFIGRMRSEERKTMASAWVDFAEGKGERPKGMDAALERELAAKFGVVDPERGFTFDESGRSMERPVTTKKKFNEEPESLKQDRLQRMGADTGYGGKWEQAALNRKLARGEVLNHLYDAKLGDNVEVTKAETAKEPNRRDTKAELKKLIGSSEVNVDSGWTIQFSSRGVKKATSGSPSREQLTALASLRDLVRKAVLAYSAGDLESQARPDVHAFHALFAPLEIDGQLKRVRLTLKETKQHGDAFYTLDPEADIQIENPASIADDRSQPDGPTPSASSPPGTIKISQLLNGALGPKRTPIVSDGSVAEYFQAPPEGRVAGAPRGSIQMRLGEGGKPVSLDISIFNGDKSTFAHEFGHFLSWSLHELALSDVATPELKTDYAKLLEFAGYDSPEQRLAERGERAQLSQKGELSPEEQRRANELTAKEEKISHAWEQYLAEGKAPSRRLDAVFNRFKDWMLFVYKGLQGIGHQFTSQYGGELKVSDEVRGIFDRLLAVDSATERAREETATPKTGAAEIIAIMSPEEREKYENILAEARSSADAEVQKRIDEIRDERAGKQREVLQRQAETELDADPANRAMRFLQRGELVDSSGAAASGKELPEALRDETGAPLKLNRKMFVDKFGPDASRSMPTGIFSSRKRGGVDIDALAPMLGFESGKDLVGAMSGEHRDAAVARVTQEKMDRLYGPALEHLQVSAMAALHNDKTIQATMLELRAMAKQVDPATAGRVKNIDPKKLRAVAARMLDSATVGELDPNRYARAERKAALEAAELWGKGKKEQAIERREARLLNQILYVESRERAEELDSAKAKLERTTDEARAQLGKADPVFRDTHDALLAAAGLGEAPEADSRASLESMLKLMDDSAQEVAFDADAIKALLASPKDWDSLPVADAYNLLDALENIRHAAKERNELKMAGKAEARDAWFADFEKHLALRPKEKLEPYDSNARTTADKVRSLKRGADALLSDVAETYSHMLDVGDRNGPVSRLLIDARLKAREQSNDLAKRVLHGIAEKWENVPKEIRKLQGERVEVELPLPKSHEGGYAPIYTRTSLWMLFLNWGNESNRQRIRDGNGWSDGQVQTALGQLTKPELQFLQGVLDSIHSMYPDLAEAHERRTGLKLGKIEAAPTAINGESYAGGYFPLRYDQRGDNSRAGEMQENDAIKAIFAPNYQKPTTPSSHRKGRVQKVNAPVLLDWGVVPAHMAQVIHDISYGDWVRDVASVIMDPRFKSLTRQYMGEERSGEFVPWLRDVANARADSSAGSVSPVLRWAGAIARNRATAVAMAYNLPNVLQGMADPWNAKIEGVDGRYITSAYLKVVNPANWNALPEFAESKELAYRADNYLKNLRQTLLEAGDKSTSGVYNAALETGLKLYEITDAFSSRVVFKAAFDQAMSEGMLRGDAIRRADDVVRRRFGTGDLAEKARILRSKNGLAAALMFHSYANRNYNGLRRAYDTMYVDTHAADATPADKASAVSSLAAKLMFMGFAGALGAYYTGRGPTKDESKEEWLTKRVLLEPFNSIPFFGPLVENGWMRLFSEKAQPYSFKAAPELNMVSDTVTRLNSTIATLKSDQKTNEDKVMSTIDALLFFGGPGGGQTHRTLDYLNKVRTGEVRPRGPGDVASGLIYGTRKDQGANAFTDLQNIASGR